MYDLKEYMILSEKALCNSLGNADKLGKLGFISDDLAYWKELFTYSEARSALENFLLYRTAGAFELYEEGADDADITKPALNELKRRLFLPCVRPRVKYVEVGEEIDNKEISDDKKPRVFHVLLEYGRDMYLESDTANSLWGDLGGFLRNILEREYGYGDEWADATYIKDYGLAQDGSKRYYKPFRFYFFYTLISKLKGELQEKFEKVEIDCLEILEKRARLTYILENMILVPYGYNFFRGANSTYKTRTQMKDRPDLMFKDFEEMLGDAAFGDAEFQTRLSNEKCTVDSVKFLLENKKALFPPIPYLNGIEGKSASAILERSKIIIETLSD